MFARGEKIHFHNGKVGVVRRDGVIPSDGRRRSRWPDTIRIRGFVRGELVNAITGEVQRGDWHENVIVGYGHAMIARAYGGIVSSASTGLASATSDVAWARYWGIGNHTLATSDYNTLATRIQTEYGISSNQTTGDRAHVSLGSVAVSTQTTGWAATYSNTIAYASSSVTNGATINCVALYHNSAQGAGTSWSYATFASSTKGSNQALNLTYTWVAQT